MEDCWLADRTLLRSLLHLQPTWTLQDYAAATHRSLAWVKKWRKRFHDAVPDDEHVLHSRSRTRTQPPPRLDPFVIERILALRDAPPAYLQRIPGPKAILYFLAHDPELQSLGLRLPRSTRTIWQILRQHGRIAIPSERRHTPVERPEPMTAWQLDLKDASTVPAETDGKQQHVVEVLNTIDTGTSILVNVQVREDFTAETTLEAIVETLRQQGQRYVRKVKSNGTVSVDRTFYYIDQAWHGRYVTLRLQAATRVFAVEYREQVLKEVPLKGMVGEELPLEVYLEQMKVEAQTQYIGGRPVGRQLRLPV